MSFITLNDPNGSYDAGSFRGPIVPVARFNGTIGELRIGAVDYPDEGGIVIDTTQLEVKNIVMYDEINGRSNVVLKASGNVSFFNVIDGRSIVVVESNGTVTLQNKVDGRSRVRIKAANLTVNEKVSGGPCTQFIYDAPQTTFRVGANGGAILQQMPVANVFGFQGPPFDDDCGQQDPDEQFRFRIPQRAARLRDFLISGNWDGF